MKFCTKCGNEVVKGTLFCTSCGNDLREDVKTKAEPDVDLDTTSPELDYDIDSVNNESKSNNDMDSVSSETDENPIEHLKLSKKSKVYIALFVILIVLVFTTIKVGNSMSDPSKVVTRFENDVATNNVSDLSKILYSSDTRLKIDSKSISPLLSYFKSKPTYLNEVMQDLEDDSISPKDIRNLNIKSDHTLTLASDGKSFLIFPKYKINIKPSFINIKTTVKDVSFSIDNTVIGKSDTENSTKQFGPYIPGTYSILANYKNNYVTLSKPYSVDLIDANGTADISVFDDMNYLNITSDQPSAEIFVNGKDTKVTVKDATHFGPINSSSKIHATSKIDGKTLTSDEFLTTSDSKDVFLSFADASNTINDIHTQLDNLLYNYSSSLSLAVNNNDPSYIDAYVAYGSSLYNDQKSYIPKASASGVQETYNNSSIIKYNINDDNKSGTITSSEYYTIYINGTDTPKSFSYIYGFKYDDSKGYQLTSISKAK